MKTAKAHRKFAIYSNFLDVILEGEEEIAEGESRKDTLKRILAELEETAAELRKEISPTRYAGDVAGMQLYTSSSNFSLQPFAHGTIPTISKDAEKLEISIDNCTSLDELATFKELAGKAGLVSAYMRKLNELTKAI